MKDREPGDMPSPQDFHIAWDADNPRKSKMPLIIVLGLFMAFLIGFAVLMNRAFDLRSIFG